MASLLLIFFYAGKKIGRLETQVSDIEKKVIAEREWGALKNQVETLYNVYVIEALSSSKKDTNSGKSGQGR